MKRVIRFVCVPLVWFCFYFRRNLQAVSQKELVSVFMDGLPGYGRGHPVYRKTVWMAGMVLHLATGK